MAFPEDVLGLTVELDAATILLTEDFEGASPLDNFDAVSAGRLTVQAGSLRNGTMGVEVAPSLSTAFLRWRERLWRDGAASYPYWSARFYVRFPGSLPSTPPPSIFSCLTVGSVDDFTFFYNVASGTWRWDLDQGASADGPEVLADQWYLVEAKGFYGSNNWDAQVRINGVEYDEVGVFGNGAEVVHSGFWGVGTALQTWTADMDDFAMAVGDYPIGFLGPPSRTRTWTDITDLVYGRDDLTITRGRSDEAQQVDRGRCGLTVNNRSGNLSPRNPTGVFYSKIGRNTPLRVRVDDTSPKYLLLSGSPYSNGSLSPPQTEVGADDSALLSTSGDIDIRIDIQPDSWDSYGQGLCNKYLTTGNQRSWLLWLNDDGTLTFSWSEDGTNGAGLLNTETSTAAVSVPASGRLALRVTLDINNGAAGYDVKFYTASTIDGSWTQLGNTVTGGSTTSIFDSSAQVEIGRAHTTIPASGLDADLRGRVYAFQVRDGIDGDLIADVRFDSMTEAGETTFVDGLDNEWTLSGDTTIVDPSVRFFGEVSEWPSRWDVSGNDVHVPIEASGILRRLGQGDTALKSALRRGYTSASFTPVAYWPCEDGNDATQIASGLPGHPPMRAVVVGGAAAAPDFGANDDFKCSAPLPTMSEVQATGHVPTYTNTNVIQLFFLLKVPAGGTTNDEGLIALYTTGSARRWSIVYGTGGTLELTCQNSSGTEILSTGAVAFDVDGKLLRVDLELSEDGADVDYDLAILEVGASAGSETFGTLSSRTINQARTVVVNPGANLNDVVFGHISVHDEIRSLFDLWEELNAHVGETAIERMTRLCEEESVTFRRVGGTTSTATMGPQLPTKFLDLLQECAKADGGILYEARDMFALAYRPLLDLGDQPVRLTLDYDSAHLSGMEPVDDDQHTRNDVTVQRAEGSSFRVEKTEGPLRVDEPPDGVGRYDELVTLNLETDDLCEDAAGWRVHLGTVDEARYPQLKLDLARPVFTAGGTTELAIQDLDVGDRLVVTDPPAWLPPDDIDQQAQGFVEVLNAKTHTITVNCSPGTPWSQVGTWDDADARYTSDGTVLDEDLDTTETAVTVAIASGPLWSSTDGNFDIVVGGERMTVTAVAGASSPQTFTVTRSVNGVVKSHLTGAEVELFAPKVWAP